MKNVRSLVMNCAFVLLAVLTLGFMAGNYIAGGTGYDLLNALDYIGYGDAGFGIYILAVFFAFVLALVIFVFAALGLLCDFNVIKSEKTAKAFRIVKMVLACLVFALNLVAIVISFAEIGTAGWAIFINLIVSAGMVAVAVTDMVLAHKK